MDSTSFEGAKHRYVEEAINCYFIGPQRRAILGEITYPETAMLDFGGGVTDEAFGIRVPPRTPAEILDGLASAFQFFGSPACQALPFVDLESSLLASLEVDEKSRPYARGDFYDVQTWATYVPNVDIAVADSQMCGVLKRRNLAAKYGCLVLPHTAAGLEELIVRLREWTAD